MTIEWPLLLRVRERHREAALEQVAEQRRACAAGEARLQQAEAALQERSAARAALWAFAQQTGSALSVAQLGHTSAWGRVLDGQVAQAAAAAREAERALAAEHDRLAATRRALQAALNDLDRAQQMHDRQRAALRAHRLQRADEAADEAAAQAWVARRSA